MCEMLGVNTPAMAEDLELKMKNLIEGYEQLDMISSRVNFGIVFFIKFECFVSL